jgi:hypothetical protein
VAYPFTSEYRDRVRDRVLELAGADERIVSGALIGSLVVGGDRWSDLDLTFGVADGVPVQDVLEDWTRNLVEELEAVQLFDLPSGATIYRVFLLPGCLQFDLSFAPASAFGAGGPRFKLLFGEAVERPYAEPPAAEELFGYAVHHALRGRFNIERGNYWQAEFWIGELRDHALSLACRRRDLPARYGRGFDDLPADVHDRFRGALIGTLERGELERALATAIDGLLHEAEEVRELAGKVGPQLRMLAGDVGSAA